MKIEEIKINKENKYFKIINNPEDPFIKISSTGEGTDTIEAGEKAAFIEINISHHNGEVIKKVYSSSNLHATPSIEEIFPLLNDSTIKFVELELVRCDSEIYYIDLVIQTGRDLINIKNPIEAFHKHINNPSNTKILFSGPFGQGKTTFLEHFFHGENTVNSIYEVFKVFPVNYSVASNEDVFKYIKTDILFQLLAKDVEFDKSEISLISAFEEYIYLNPKKAILSFLKNASHLNAKTEVIAKVVESLNEFMKPIFEYHKKGNKNEKELAIDYINEIYEKEGSLFEDNFYTQLIRQLLERLKNESKKVNVLIIEDLDRMDPDHIFRILNVISAHYDNYNFNGDNEHHNKFGFDKIILVCDVKNIENIFHHKYGENTDFDGYMNKYFSSKPFEYDNKKTMIYLLENEYLLGKGKIDRKKEITQKSLQVILKIFILHDQLSLRELLKLKIEKYQYFQKQLKNGHYFFARCAFTNPIAFLFEKFSYEVLLRKIQNLKAVDSSLSSKEATHQCRYLITGCLDFDSAHATEKVTAFSFKGKRYKVDVVEDHFDDILKLNSIEREEEGGLPPSKTIVFKQDDFYDLLIENIKKYNQIENA